MSSFTLPTMSSLYGVPDASYLDSLIGQDAGAFLDGLPKSKASTASQINSPASPAESPSFDLGTVDGASAAAKQYGWADPAAFAPDNLEALRSRGVDGDGGGFAAGEQTHKMKDSSNWKSNNNESWAYFTPASNEVRDEWGQVERPKVDGGYSVVAGELPGAKRYTRAFYNYTPDGKYTGMHFEADEKGLEGAAPLINMALMAAGAGGFAGTLGSSINSSLGLGLGNIGQAALGGATLGGGAAALSGGDIGKGILTGGIGGAVGAANPAGALGIKDPNLLKLVNRGAAGLAQSVVSGGDPRGVLLNTAMGAVMPPTMSTLLNIAKR